MSDPVTTSFIIGASTGAAASSLATSKSKSGGMAPIAPTKTTTPKPTQVSALESEKDKEGQLLKKRRQTLATRMSLSEPRLKTQTLGA